MRSPVATRQTAQGSLGPTRLTDRPSHPQWRMLGRKRLLMSWEGEREGGSAYAMNLKEVELFVFLKKVAKLLEMITIPPLDLHAA